MLGPIQARGKRISGQTWRKLVDIKGFVLGTDNEVVSHPAFVEQPTHQIERLALILVGGDEAPAT